MDWLDSEREREKRLLDKVGPKYEGESSKEYDLRVKKFNHDQVFKGTAKVTGPYFITN